MIDYKYHLVLIAAVVAVLGAYTSLVIFEKAIALKGRERIWWIAYSAAAFGLGMTSMHYIGILAMKRDFSVHYDLFLIGVSIIIPLITSFLSFLFLVKFINEKKKIFIPALFFSLGILSLHYIGLEAIIFAGEIIWDLPYILSSFFLLFVISYFWLYLLIHARNKNAPTFGKKWLISLVMGLSIPSMHFLSMTGTHFFIMDMVNHSSASSMGNMSMTFLVTLMTGFVLIIGITFIGYERSVMLNASKLAELKYQSLFEQYQDAIFTFDPDGNFLTVNPAGEKMLGQSKEQLVNKSFQPFIDESDLEATLFHFRKALNGISQEYFITARIQGKEDILLQVKNIPMLWKGKVIGVYGICSDITEIYKNQREIKEKESLYRSTISAMSDALVVCDKEGNIIVSNSNAARMFGINENEFRSLSFFDSSWKLVKEDGTKYNVEETPLFTTVSTGETFRQAIIGVKGFKGDFKKTIWVSLKTEPLLIDGQLEGAVLTYTDITKKLEQEKQLEISNQLMLTLIENLQLGVLVEDIERNIMLMNKEILNTLGLQLGPEELIGKPFNVLYPHLEKQLYNYNEVTTRTKEMVSERKYCSDEVAMKNGKVVQRSFIPIFSDGKYQGNIWKLEDVTEQRMMAESLIQAKETAEKANNSKSEFLSKMSHELRTPLNAVLGFAQILEYDTQEPLTIEQNQKIQEILYAGRHLLNLINEVLDLSRIESGKLRFNIKPVFIQEVIERSIRLVEPIADEKEISITLEGVSLSGILLNIDQTRFKQIITNLLTNAIKYNRTGGNIVIYTDITSNQFLLQIRDTGYGIPTDVLPNIFEPFFRYKQIETKVEGNGIGLSIAKLMTEKMGGSIEAESVVEKGSTFTLRFPLISGELELEEVKNINKENYRFDERKILYIEDLPSNALLVEKIIDGIDGIQLNIMYTPGEGIIAAKQIQPDLILLDINLPGMSGYELLEILKQMEDTKHIPVLALSAEAMEEDIEKAMKMGFSGYITKPIDIPAFISTLHDYLEIKTTR